MRIVKPALGIVAVLLLAGCTTLTPQEKTQYTVMEKDQVLVKEKNPSSGAWFGLLPGGGSFYGREPLVGVVDLLLWPISVLWDPVIGYEMSKKVNYEVTVAELERNKAKEMTTLDNDHDLKKISDTEYVTRKREIEQKYDYHKL
jgi:hypothetical protein